MKKLLTAIAIVFVIIGCEKIDYQEPPPPTVAELWAWGDNYVITSVSFVTLLPTLDTAGNYVSEVYLSTTDKDRMGLAIQHIMLLDTSSFFNDKIGSRLPDTLKIVPDRIFENTAGKLSFMTKNIPAQPFVTRKSGVREYTYRASEELNVFIRYGDSTQLLEPAEVIKRLVYLLKKPTANGYFTWGR